MGKEKEFRVVIPKENFKVLSFKQEGFIGIASVNRNLVDFEPKEVFSWHCSLMINCNDIDENVLPAEKELKILDKFENILDDKIKGHDKGNPNALFLARITWNKTQELIWRIYDPEITNAYLIDLIDQNNYLRDFDYRIDEDVEWKLTEWHLKER